MNTITCPKCESNKVSTNPIMKYMLIGSCLYALIPIIGWITAPILWIMLGVAYYIKKKKRIELMKCRECKNQFRVDKEQYLEYSK